MESLTHIYTQCKTSALINHAEKHSLRRLLNLDCFKGRFRGIMMSRKEKPGTARDRPGHDTERMVPMSPQHTTMFPENLRDYAPWVSEFGLVAPYGICQCGCGKKTRLAPKNLKRDGLGKGEPVRYVKGHSGRTLSFPDNFWSRVRKTGTCWLWTGANAVGYGKVQVDGKPVYAHRVSWELHRGPIPDGLLVLHTCDQPACVRPDHLFLGTQRENLEDMFAKGRDNHARGEKQGHAKLTENDVRKIRKARVQGETLERIARQYSVGLTTIYKIVQGKTWKHVK